MRCTHDDSCTVMGCTRKLPEITEIQRLAIRPGDRLIVRYSGRASISQQEAADIKGKILAMLQLPPDFPLLIMDQDWQVLISAAGQAGVRYQVDVSDELLAMPRRWADGLRLVSVDRRQPGGFSRCTFEDDNAPPELEGKLVMLTLGTENGKLVVLSRDAVGEGSTY